MPYPAQGLKVHSVTHNRATVEWEVRTVVFTSEVYIIKYWTVNSKYRESQPTTDKKITLYQLIPNSDYYVRVIASNSIGNTTSLTSYFRTTYRKFKCKNEGAPSNNLLRGNTITKTFTLK